MDMRSKSRRATACLVFSLIALVLAVAQYILLMYLYVRGDSVTDMYDWVVPIAWLGPPLLSFIFAILCFVFFGLSYTQSALFRVRRITGLIVGILSLPVNVFFFLFGIACILIGG